MHKFKKISIFVFLVLFLMMVSCSPETKYAILSFIFDGVPEPVFTENENPKNDTVIKKDSINILAVAENKKPETFFHMPYAERNCNGCHNNDMGQTLKQQPDLCYTCHENFEDNYKIIHGPAAGGYCTACHEPHKAKYPKLLVKEGKELCLTCHDKSIPENDMHSIAETSDCTKCHNPHGEENKFLLAKGACYQCHDNFEEKYKHLHGPVGGGFCNSCHDTHNSEKEYKLYKTGQDLCLMCHKKTDVLKNENHEGIEDANCTECHNPHGGDDRYMFN